MQKYLDEINYETYSNKVSKLKQMPNILEQQIDNKHMSTKNSSIYFEKLDPIKYKHNNDMLREMYNLFIEMVLGNYYSRFFTLIRKKSECWTNIVKFQSKYKEKNMEIDVILTLREKNFVLKFIEFCLSHSKKIYCEYLQILMVFSLILKILVEFP